MRANQALKGDRERKRGTECQQNQSLDDVPVKSDAVACPSALIPSRRNTFNIVR